jgi:hypothetical protein
MSQQPCLSKEFNYAVCTHDICRLSCANNASCKKHTQRQLPRVPAYSLLSSGPPSIVAYISSRSLTNTSNSWL